ncbi:unnamed protein product, partial [Prorocentrum cordatum]
IFGSGWRRSAAMGAALGRDAGRSLRRLQLWARGTELWAQQWAEAAGEFGDLQALAYDGPGPKAAYTYAELESRARGAARGLRRLYGIRRGDRVATITENRPEQVILLIACLQLGAIFVPLPPDFRASECAHFLQVLQPRLVVLPPGGALPHGPAGGGSWLPECIQLPLAPRAGAGAWHELESCALPQEIAVSARAGDCGLIFTSSGSTALPKCVMHSQRTLAAIGAEKRINQVLYGSAITNGPGSSRLINSGIRGITATYGLLTTLPYGGRVVMENVFGSESGPAVWADLMRQQKISKVVLFGSSMRKLIADLPGQQFPLVASVVYSGCCFPPCMVQQAMAMFPHAEFLQPYSMTEMPHITVLPAHLHWSDAKDEERLRVMSCAGFPHGSRVWLEDPGAPGSGRAVPLGLEGQVCVKSPTMMMGYYGVGGLDRERTAEVAPDGYLRTGDLGVLVAPESGGDRPLLRITGRFNDFIAHIGGRNIAPREIEEVVFQLSGQVADVCVVGLPHPSGAGEVVAAYVVTKPGTSLTRAQLVEHCRLQGLSSSRTPELWFLRGSERPLPLANGKASARALRSLACVQAEARQLARGDLLRRPAAAAADASAEPWAAQARAVLSSAGDGRRNKSRHEHTAGAHAKKHLACLQGAPALGF